jgi:Asp-tRNA(Asn)/Glu-tRNA(Gln) amidotransferase C subunit
MEEQVRRLNREYGFDLSEDEIKLVARQAEEAERLFRSLHEIDLTHVMPILKVDHKKVEK